MGARPGAADAPFEFVGRQGELARLWAWWERGREQSLAVISGEPGVGKTCLARRFASELAATGVVVLRGAATEHRFLPYEPWVKALRAHLTMLSASERRRVVGEHERDLARVPWLRDLADVPAAEPWAIRDESVVAAAVGGLLAQLSRGGSCAVVIDDVQWADAASVRLLERLASARGVGAFVVVERRPTTARGAWRAGPPTVARHEVAVPRFDRSTSAALVRAEVSLPVTETDADAFHEASGGNAVVLEGLLQLARLGRFARPGGRDELPAAATSIWAERLAEVPPRVVDGLSVASVLGTEFERSVVQAASRGESWSIEVEQPAHAYALVEEVDGRPGTWRFTHALLREHLYSRLTATRRQRLHRAVAEALRAQSGPEPSDRSAQMAHHFGHSGPSGARAALAHTVDAARWALRQGSPETSGQLARDALARLDAFGSDARREPDVLHHRVDLGDLLLRLGDPAGGPLMDDATEHFEAVGDIHALARIADSRLRAGTSLGQADAGSRLAERLVGRLDGVDPRLHSRVLARLARVLEGRVGADELIASVSAAALELARRTDDPETLAVALYCCGTAEPWGDERLDRGRELMALGARQGDLEYGLLGRHVVCTQLVDRGDVEGAAAVLAEIGPLAARIPAGYVGVVRNADLARVAELVELNQRAVRAQLSGDFEEQEQLLVRLQRFSSEAGVERDRVDAILLAQHGLLAFDRGNLADYAELSIALARAQPETTHRQISTAFALSWIGRTDEAREFYEPIVGGGLRSVTVEQSMAFMLILLGWTAKLLDDAEGGRLVDRRLGPFSGRGSCYFGGSLGPVDGGLAFAAWAQGERDAALHRFGRAIQAADRWGARPIGARLRVARAELTVERGGAAPDPATDLREASATADELGMPEVAGHARRLLDEVVAESSRSREQ